MASLPTITRRLYRNQPSHHLLKLIHYPISNSPSCSPSSLLYPSPAFHQTLLLPPLYARQFSTPPLSIQNLNDPFQFNIGKLQIHVPNDEGVIRFVEILRRVAHLPSEVEAVAALDEFDIPKDSNLVFSAVWELRDEWRMSLLAFKWGEKWGFVDGQICNLMVWVLGNHRKFNTAWGLIRELHGSLMDMKQAMLIMIDRYASANEASKAIKTFHMMEKFRLTPDQEAYQALLNSLCKNGNIEEAEEFMFVNKKLFPLETESFNIILYGWCNISIDIFEAKRVWREMSKCCIAPDASSYTHMISCFSKTGNLFDSLRLYDEMKRRNWVPGLEIYNSLVYVLTRENCFSEALKILKKMKETGLRPDSTTYNSLIHPLCEAGKLDEARDALTMMTEDGISPTVETYHSFLEGVGERSSEVLKQMSQDGVGPTKDTFIIVLNKSFELEQPDYALKMWAEMKQYEVLPNSEHYSILIQGLSTCCLVKKAREFYDEMISSGFIAHPKIKGLLKEPEVVSTEAARQQVRYSKKGKVFHRKKESTTRQKLYRKQSRMNSSFE